MNWLYSSKRKIHQRAMNKLIRKVNQIIKEDSLWKGRFIISQEKADWVYYHGGGGELYVSLKFTDRLTQNTVKDYGTVNHWRHFNGMNLFIRLNKFIVEDCAIWSENPCPNTPEYMEMISKCNWAWKGDKCGK